MKKIIARTMAVAVSAAGIIAAHTPSSAWARCVPSESYRVTSQSTNYLGKTQTWMLDNLDGNVTNSMSEAQYVSGSTAISFSGSVGADVDIVFAGVNASTTLGVTKTLTYAKTYTVTVYARPGTIGYGNISVRRLKTVGAYTYHNEDCTTTTNSVTAYTPYMIAGRTWGG